MPAGSGASGHALADPASRWSDLTLRALSALVLLPLALGCLWAGGWWFMALCVALSFGVAVEWAAMCGCPATGWPGNLLPPAMVFVTVLAGSGGSPYWAAAAALLAVTLLTGLGAAPNRGGSGAGQGKGQAGKGQAGEGLAGEGGAGVSGASRAWLLFGLLYIGPAAIALPWLRADPGAGFANTLFMLLIVWASDIGAYTVGRLVGGPKLAPSISPGKTRSGAVGGLVAAVLVGLAVAACFSRDFSPSRVIVLAMALGVLSQAGDLLESALKRHFRVKDSGRLIPGHGGLLDRLDALLTVAPAAAALAFSVGRGVVLWR